MAQELSHPFSLAFALWTVLPCSISIRREGQAAQERAEAADCPLDRARVSADLALGTILRGWALAEQGQEEEGIAQIRQGLAACAGYRGRARTGRIILPCWPRRMGKRDR